MRERVATAARRRPQAAVGASELTISHVPLVRPRRPRARAAASASAARSRSSTRATDLGCVKELLRAIDAGKRFDAQAVLARISNAKNAFQRAEELPEREGDDYDEITKAVYPRYQAALRAFKAFDFDDLVCERGPPLGARPDVLERWQSATATSSSTSTRTRTARSSSCCASSRRAPERVRRRRRRPGHLRLARRRRAQHPRLRGRTSPARRSSSSSRTTARVRPSSTSPTPSSRKRADAKWQQGALHRARGRRQGAARASPPTPEVEASWVGEEIATARPRRAASARARSRSSTDRTASRRRIEEALREQGVAAPRGRRAAVLRAQGGEGPPRVHEARAEPERRDQPPAHHQLPAARDRRARASRGSRSRALAKGWTLWQAVERVDALDDVSGAARDGCRALDEASSAETRRRALATKRPPSEVGARLVRARRAEGARSTRAPRRTTRRAGDGRTWRACSRRSRGARRASGEQAELDGLSGVPARADARHETEERETPATS